METGNGGTTNLAEGKLSASDVRRLYGQHGPALLAYACSFVSDLATGEDVVHQVFLRLLQGKTTMPDVPIASMLFVTKKIH